MTESKFSGSLASFFKALQSESPKLGGSKSASPAGTTSSPSPSPQHSANKAAASVSGAAAAAGLVTPVTSPATISSSNINYSSGSIPRGFMFPAPNCRCLFLNVIPFMDESSIVALMRTCRRAREVTTSDDVWESRLKDMRVNVILVNRTNNFFRAFRSEIVTLRGLEGTYDFESETAESSQGAAPMGSSSPGGSPVSAVKKVLLTIAPAFLGFVTPVARIVLIVEYYGMAQKDVFEGTMRYSFPKRLFVMSTYLTRCPRQEGPRFDVVVARSMRKWGTQKLSHFEAVRGGTRLIISIAQSAQAPANGYLPSNELLTVSRVPRDGENAAALVLPVAAPLPLDPVGAATSGADGKPNIVSSTEKRFSLRSLLGGR